MFRNSRPHSAVPPEEVDTNTTYSFSINPSKQYETQKTRLKLIQNDLCKTLSYLGNQKVFSFELYPELSQTGRLHWHGDIKIYNVLEFYTNLIRIKDHVTFEIDTIDDMTKWNEYKTKGLKYMKDSGLHLPLTHTTRKDTMLALAGLKPKKGAIDDYLAELGALAPTPEAQG